MITGNVLLGLALALIGALVWIIRLEGRVNEAHRKIADLKERVMPLEKLPEAMARVEEQMKGLSSNMGRLADSVSWMRQPADYRLDGVVKPK